MCKWSEGRGLKPKKTRASLSSFHETGDLLHFEEIKKIDKKHLKKDSLISLNFLKRSHKKISKISSTTTYEEDLYLLSSNQSKS